jgi:hypothetical protein
VKKPIKKLSLSRETLDAMHTELPLVRGAISPTHELICSIRSCFCV